MSYKVLVNDDVKLDNWNEFLQKNEFRNPFQSPEGLKFFRSLDSMTVDVHAVAKDAGEISALILVTVQQESGFKKHLSQRGIIYAGPMLTDEESAKVLVEHLQAYYKKKAIYLETRNFFDYSKYAEVFKGSGWEYIPWLNFHLTTDEEAPMRKRMSSSRLRQVKKGIKNGAEFMEAKNIDDVKSFYSILQELYQEKIKKPLPKWDFFERFFESDMGKYLLVYFEGKVIGGIMCPIQEGSAIYEWYIAGKDGEFRDQYPSVLATYAAMDYGLKNNMNYFDFMGAGAVDEEYGVRDFKARFGGKELEHGRFLLILNKTMYQVGKKGLSLMSKLKS